MKITTLSAGLSSAALSALLAVTCLAGPAAAAVPAVTSDLPVSSISEAEQAKIIGENGARMGQGLHRITVNGDAQVPSANDAGGTPAGSANAPAASAKSLDASRDAATPMGGNWRPAGIQGMDVSSHQGNVDWARAWAQGSRFVYAKSTEGTGYKNPNFGQQYSGSYDSGMIRGAYHFALPNVSSAVEQANYFVNNGGGWSADGKTLPPLLDIEYNPYPSLGNTCYSMTPAQMVNWIKSFSNQVQARTGRTPMIYTTTDWWSYCTGNSAAFGDNPLHLANYNEVGAGVMPASWDFHSIWQYSSTGPFVGDSNVWNGSSAGLTAFAKNSGNQAPAPAPAPAPVAPKPVVTAPPAPIPAPATGPFRDVPASADFVKDIAWLKSTKVTTGYADGTYQPLSPVSREAMAAFLYRISGRPAYTPPAQDKSKFKDIAGSEFYKEINWLASRNVATGWDGNQFAPGLSVNRDAMAAFLYRLAGSPAYNAPKVSPFKDVPVNNQYYKEISWLAATGISTGWSDGTFRPYDTIKRDAMAAFLHRYDTKF